MLRQHLIDIGTGQSHWMMLEHLKHIEGIRGNGSAYIQDDRGLGRKYNIDKDADKKYHPNGSLKAFRLSGYKPDGWRPQPKYSRTVCPNCGELLQKMIAHIIEVFHDQRIIPVLNRKESPRIPG